MGHGDNKDRNFDDEEHCKTMSGVLINNTERQSQNKIHPSHSIGLKTSFEQMKEISNKQRHKKAYQKNYQKKSNELINVWNKL